MIPRTLAPVVPELAGNCPVVTVTGPRQSGKTTLSRAAFPENAYVNLESPDLREFARSDPRGFLSAYSDGQILDELQRVPELASYLQPMVDARGERGLFVLTGSQQFGVMTTLTQSLAGRTALFKLLPLSKSSPRSSTSTASARPPTFWAPRTRLMSAATPSGAACSRAW